MSPRASAPARHVVESKEPMRLAELALRVLWKDADERLVLRRWRDRFYLWTPETGSYAELHTDAMNAALYQLLDATKYRSRTRDGELVKRPIRPRSSTVREVTLALVAETLVYGDAPQWLVSSNVSPDAILAVRNGLLDVHTRELKDLSPNFFTTVASPVRYDPMAVSTPRWSEFLRELWGDDQESKNALAEWFGYCLTPDTRQQKILLIVGPKRAGKGTILKILSGLVGPSNVCAPTLSSLGAPFGLSPLLNRSVATITDARLSGRIDQAQITERLLSISGEDRQTIDRKHMAAIDARLRLRFVIISNEYPKLRDSSGALASRFLVLPLTRSFYGVEDLGLESAIADELPGILNWALSGLERLRSRGYFLQPAAGRDAVRELEELGSPVAAFVRDSCTQGQCHQVSVKALFHEWTLWAEEHGFSKGDSSTFGRNLRAVVPALQVTQPRIEGRQERVYRGIGIVRDSDV